MTTNRHDPLGPAIAVAEPTTTPTAQAPTPASGLKKRNLGGIAKKKDDTSNKYPVFPDEKGAAAELAARIAERQEQFDALKSSLETDKAELARTLIRPWYFQHFHRKTDVPSSVLVNWTTKADPEAGTEDKSGTVRVTVKEQYYSFPSEDPFVPILGDQVAKLSWAGCRVRFPLFDQQLEGHRVTVQGRRGPVPGVVAVRSIHLSRGRNAPSEAPFTDRPNTCLKLSHKDARLTGVARCVRSLFMPASVIAIGCEVHRRQVLVRPVRQNHRPAHRGPGHPDHSRLRRAGRWHRR